METLIKLLLSLFVINSYLDRRKQAFDFLNICDELLIINSKINVVNLHLDFYLFQLNKNDHDRVKEVLSFSES